MWESREMLFGENAIRRPPVAVHKTMPHVLVMYIAIYSRRAALAGSALRTRPMAVFFAYCRIVATDIHFIACMRYRRGRPKHDNWP